MPQPGCPTGGGSGGDPRLTAQLYAAKVLAVAAQRVDGQGHSVLQALRPEEAGKESEVKADRSRKSGRLST